jgi:hypothetical protein
MDPEAALAFLSAYRPRFLCITCLSAMMQTEPALVLESLGPAIASGRVESAQRPCLNCERTGTAMRVRPPTI